MTWSGSKGIQLPQRNSWELSPLSTDDLSEVVQQVKEETAARRESQKDRAKEAAGLNRDWDTTLIQEQRWELNERFRRSRALRKRRSKTRRVLAVLSLTLVAALALIYFDGPWSAPVDTVVDRAAVKALIAQALNL